jgi:hypothetical protein
MSVFKFIGVRAEDKFAGTAVIAPELVWPHMEKLYSTRSARRQPRFTRIIPPTKILVFKILITELFIN